MAPLHLLCTPADIARLPAKIKKSSRSSDFELAQCVLVLGAMVTEWSGNCCVFCEMLQCV